MVRITPFYSVGERTFMPWWLLGLTLSLKIRITTMFIFSIIKRYRQKYRQSVFAAPCF